MLLTHNSAELEMTVNILIQIDKLVQLIESPVFTCEYQLRYASCSLFLCCSNHGHGRSSFTAS